MLYDINFYACGWMRKIYEDEMSVEFYYRTIQNWCYGCMLVWITKGGKVIAVDVKQSWWECIWQAMKSYRVIRSVGWKSRRFLCPKMIQGPCLINSQ